MMWYYLNVHFQGQKGKKLLHFPQTEFKLYVTLPQQTLPVSLYSINRAS